MSDRSDIEAAVDHTGRLVNEMVLLLQRHGLPLIAKHLATEILHDLANIERIAKKMPA
jgi:hypothetical protein